MLLVIVFCCGFINNFKFLAYWTWWVFLFKIFPLSVVVAVLTMRWFLFAFQMTTIIRGEFIGDGIKSSRDTCINFITIIDPSFILPVSSITCSGNQQATFTVEDIGYSEAGYKCSDNMVLVNYQICGKLTKGCYTISIDINWNWVVHVQVLLIISFLRISQESLCCALGVSVQ